MTKYTSDAVEQPKGAHNRRLSLGIEPEVLAAEAGVTTEELRDYERTAPDHDFDPEVGRRVRDTLDRLEGVLPNSQTGKSEHPGHDAPTLGDRGHASHPRLTPAELTASNLEGAPIYGPDDEKIGSISHLHGTGPGAQVVVDVGGFLGLGAKPVAIPMSELDIMRDENGKVHALTSWAKEQIKELPEHKHH